MESKQGGGEVIDNRAPRHCNYEQGVARTISGRYLYSICGFEEKHCNVPCRKDGYCAYIDLDRVYRITSSEVVKSDRELCQRYVLSNNRGDAILIERTTYGLGLEMRFPHHSDCAAYLYELDTGRANYDERLASADDMRYDLAFDEIIRQLAINFDRHTYEYKVRCRLGDRDGI